jgi:hypothetical protein
MKAWNNKISPNKCFNLTRREYAPRKLNNRYEPPMNGIFWILLISMLSSIVNAMPNISEQELSQKLAAELGFSVVAEAEGDAISIKFIGPEQVKNGCFPGRSGSYLLDPKGEELILQTTLLNKNIGKPEVLGYSADRANTMGVFIDYFCSKERLLESTRYSVPSTKEWLITNQSSRPASPSAD